MCFYLQFSWLTQLFSLGRMGFLRGWLVCFLFFAELRLQVGLSTACWTLNEELSWFGFQTLFSEPCFLVAQPERETSNQPLWRALWYSVWFNTYLSASYVLSTEKEGEIMWCQWNLTCKLECAVHSDKYVHWGGIRQLCLECIGDHSQRGGWHSPGSVRRAGCLFSAEGSSMC